MSLQVWLPLTRDVRNQGVCGGTLTTSGVTFADGGKLGGKYLSGGTITIPAATCAKFFNKNHMSFAFWLYPIGSSGSSIIMGQDSMAAGDNRMYSIFQYNTPNDLHLSWQDETSSGTFLGSVDADFFAADTWTHCCITYDGSAAKVYKNGTLVATHSGTSNRAAFNYAYPIRGSSLRKLQDVRIYDHVLSLTEIKRLAQGLVLCYPLNRNGFGQENLVTGSNSNSTSTNVWYQSNQTGGSSREIVIDNGIPCLKITRDSTEQSGWHYFHYDGLLRSKIKTDTTYTITFDLKPSVNGSITMDSFKHGNATNSISISSQTIQGNLIANKWNHVVLRTTTKSSFTDIGTSQVVYMALSSSLRASGTWTMMKNIHVEEGTLETPWIPAPEDALYTSLGLNKTIEYDISGFQNNGTRNGSFDWDSNKPKYSCSMIFNGSDNSIQTPNLTTMVSDKNYTIACWFYKDSIGSKNYQTIYGGPSGFELEARNNADTSPQLVGWNWGKPVASYTFGVWHHFAFVHTDSDCKIYLDGEYVSTGSSTSIPSGNYFIGAWRDTSSQNFEGKISDFRIYATSLSADDIKSLYKNI